MDDLESEVRTLRAENDRLRVQLEASQEWKNSGLAIDLRETHAANQDLRARIAALESAPTSQEVEAMAQRLEDPEAQHFAYSAAEAASMLRALDRACREKDAEIARLTSDGNEMATLAVEQGQRATTAESSLAAVRAELNALRQAVDPWYEAVKSHHAAVETYNARVRYIRTLPLGEANADAEFHAENNARRAMQDLLMPMFDAIDAAMKEKP
jgi:chromosome segregation ATPase